MRQLGQDFRYALRMLRTHRGTTVIAVLSLALGIGANTAFFSVIDALLLRPLPYPAPDALVQLYSAVPAKGYNRMSSSLPDVADVQAAGIMGRIAPFSFGAVNLTGQGDARRMAVVAAGSGFFDVIGTPAALGRTLRPEEAGAAAPRVMVISHGLWQRQFGGDAGIVGRELQIDGEAREIVGVMPRGFDFPSAQVDAWLPLVEPQRETARGSRAFRTIARLQSGSDIGSTTLRLNDLSRRLAQEYPGSNQGIGFAVVALKEALYGREFRTVSMLLMIAVFAVLLVACANVANLLLARAGTRTRELAIRASVGATRGRIIRQLLAESLLLATLGGLAGFALARLAVDAVATRFFVGYVPYWMTFGVSGRSLAAVAGICVVSTILCGLAPAVRASRPGTAAATRIGVRSVMAVRRDPWRARLVAIQFALAVVLLGGASLLASSYAALLRADSAIDVSRFTTMRIELPEETYATSDRRMAFYRRLEADIASMPGVEAVAFASVAPFLGAASKRTTIRGIGAAGDTTLMAGAVTISPAYFDTLEMTLLRGHDFDATEARSGLDVAIINQLLADRFFGGEDPIGRQIRLDSSTDANATSQPPGPAEEPDWLTVIGIAPTIRQAAPGGPRPLIYLPQGSAPAASAQLLIRMPTVSAGTIADIRRRVATIDDDVVVVNVRPLADTLKNSRLQPQLMATVLGSLGLIALFLSTVGLYAVTSHGVRQRTAEIGLRLALGGRPGQVVWLFVRQGMAPIAAGLLVGLTGAFMVGRLLRGLLIGTSATDPTTLAALALLLTAVTAAACVVPATRSADVDPASTLRQD